MTKEELWKAVLSEMEVTLSKANFTTWLKNTTIISGTQDSLLISVPNGFVKEWLENKFNKNIFQVIWKYQPEIRDIKYIIGTARTVIGHTKDLGQFIPEKIAAEDPLPDGDVDKNTGLNRRYTFDSFVVGANNELAFAASQAIVKNPGRTYNPLFIYGGVGLGKTHLIQAIGNAILHTHPERKIAYMSSDRLTTEIVESLKNNTVEDLKQRYTKLDLLIVDDIQFIASRERTQEIFFNAFNELYSKNKQIILSSDRQPSAIPALEQRLRSRFEGGMIADIGIPDFETRIAILNLRTKEKNFKIDDECLSYIAANIQKNIRELEGALNRIIAFSQIYNKSPDLKEVKKLLTAYISTPYRKTSHQTILKCVADFYGVSLNDLTKRSRKKEVVRPRQVAMYLLREEIKLSFPEIGTKLGGRDHSTVIHAYEKIKLEEDAEESTKQEITLIKERIYQSGI